MDRRAGTRSRPERERDVTTLLHGMFFFAFDLPSHVKRRKERLWHYEQVSTLTHRGRERGREGRKMRENKKNICFSAVVRLAFVRANTKTEEKRSG